MNEMQERILDEVRIATGMGVQLAAVDLAAVIHGRDDDPSQIAAIKASLHDLRDQHLILSGIDPGSPHEVWVANKGWQA